VGSAAARVALVTGASRGMGRVISGALAARGCRVFAGVRTAARTGPAAAPPGTEPLPLEVTDPVSGRHFTLYEFELSLARMLDGRRHASGVVENGVRLGIPIDLDGLHKFVRQLWRYGFLSPAGVVPAPDGGAQGGWPERERWDEATRTLFQTGLRLMRQGRAQDAGSYFQAVLDADPDNAEAIELLAAIAKGQSFTASPIGQRGRRGGGHVGARKGIAFSLGALVVAGAAAALLVMARRLPATPSTPPPTVTPAPAPRAAPPPVHWRTAAVQQREHPPVGELAAPDGGVVIWKKAKGARVKAGERIGLLRTEAAARGPAPIDPAAAARIRELEALAAQDSVYRDFLEKERRALQQRRPVKSAREVPLTAPETGILALAAGDRARVTRGAAIATVVDDRVWIVDAFVDGEAPPADAACELRGDAVAQRVACTLDGARPHDGGSQLMLTVKAGDAPWLEGSRSLRVRIAPPGTPPEPDVEPAGKGPP